LYIWLNAHPESKCSFLYNPFKAFNNRGSARYKEGDLDGAIKDYNEAIRLKPDHADAYYNRGVASHSQGNLDGAIKDYTEAIRLKPDYADAYWGRGSSWFSKEDYYSAADYQKYFDLGGTNESVRKYLNDAKKKIGR
jgi:tetratricopeptide (TPR) repeat protein